MYTGSRGGGKAGTDDGVLQLSEPLPDDAAQVERCAAELHRAHPELTIRRYVAYTVAAEGGRLVEEQDRGGAAPGNPAPQERTYNLNACNAV